MDDVIIAPGGPYPRTDWRPRVPAAQAHNAGLDPCPAYRRLVTADRLVPRGQTRRALRRRDADAAAAIAALTERISQLERLLARKGGR